MGRVGPIPCFPRGLEKSDNEKTGLDGNRTPSGRLADIERGQGANNACQLWRDAQEKKLEKNK